MLLPPIVADPRLRAPEQGKAQITPHRELAALVDEAHLAAVDRAVPGVENVASGVLVAVFLQVANEHHAGHRLALALVAALVADLDGVRIDQRFHAAKQQALLFVQHAYGICLAGLIVESPPAADGRSRGVSGPEGQRREAKENSEGADHVSIYCSVGPVCHAKLRMWARSSGG